MSVFRWLVVSAVCVLGPLSGAKAESAERKDFFALDENFVSHIDKGEPSGDSCGVRLSNGKELGAITFFSVQPSWSPFRTDIISGHELGTGTTHGYRKGDTFEVRVDGELLATGELDSGVAPYSGTVVEWQGALLDALAYGSVLTWGVVGANPIIEVEIPDNEAMTRALVECEAYSPNR
jgi:hypothetical protein